MSNAETRSNESGRAHVGPRQMDEGIFGIVQTDPSPPVVTAWTCATAFLPSPGNPGVELGSVAWVYVKPTASGPPGFTPLDPKAGTAATLAFSPVPAGVNVEQLASDAEVFADWIRMNAGAYGWAGLTEATLVCDTHQVSRVVNTAADSPVPPPPGDPTAGLFAITEGPTFGNPVAYVCRSVLTGGPTQSRTESWIYRLESNPGGPSIEWFRPIGTPGSGDLFFAGGGDAVPSGYSVNAESFAGWVRPQGQLGPGLPDASFLCESHTVSRVTQEPPHDRR